MNKTINEKTALELLNVNSFREVSKDKILDFMSLLPGMEPEVAKSALDQFPQFASCASKALGEFKNLAEQAILSSDDDLTAMLKCRLSTIEILSQMLEDDDLTFEQKMMVANIMTQLNIMNSEDVRQNYRFKSDTMEMVLTLFIVVIGAAVVLLGGRGRIRI